MRLLLPLLLVAGPTLAEGTLKPLDGNAFESMVRGRTLTYGQPDAPPRGIETYEPGRRVTWLEVGTGECWEGSWTEGGTPEAPQICFTYPESPDPGPYCYLYSRDGTHVISTNPDGTDPEISYLDRDTDGIACQWLGT